MPCELEALLQISAAGDKSWRAAARLLPEVSHKFWQQLALLMGNFAENAGLTPQVGSIGFLGAAEQ